MSGSCTRRLPDFWGVCCNTVHILPIFSWVRTRSFLPGFLSRSNPVGLTFLIISWTPLVLETVFPGNLSEDVLRHFLAEPPGTYVSHTETHAEQYIEPHRHTQQPVFNTSLDTAALFCEFSGSCCRRLELSHAAPADRRQVGAAQ
jgi:hypothetical protein